jgi:arylsulfatase A-like enzyme
MNALRFLPAALLLAICSQTIAAEATRPNILFIYTDDQSYKTLSCYEEAPAWVKTPNIDALARRGVRFTRSYLGAWCMPSRASLLTGRLQHGIESMRMEGEYPGSTYDPQQCPFWPAVFRKHGYHTAQIGKWHTGADAGYGRDWDFQIVWNRPGHPENAGNYYKQQILSFNGQERQVEGYSTDNYTEWAVEYINGRHRDPDKPWYLWLCYGAVHGPTTPADRHKGQYAGHEAPVPEDIFGPWPEKPAYLATTAAWERGRNGKPVMKTREKRKSNFDTDEPGLKYDAWIQQVNECALALDEGVARVMQALEETGQLKNTLVVFAADQGYGLGEHGFSQKVAPYDATIASPLIISRPGVVPEGKICRHPINSPDLVEFFGAAAGIKPDWKMHGRDIRPLVFHPETAEWNSPMLFTHTGRTYGSDTNEIPTGAALTETGNTPWYVLLRDGRYKYVRTFVEGETEEIYDLEADPEELENLAARPEHRKLLETLRAKAIEELRRTDAGFVDALPPTKAML